jgi:hypothetical protein
LPDADQDVLTGSELTVLSDLDGDIMPVMNLEILTRSVPVFCNFSEVRILLDRICFFSEVGNDWILHEKNQSKFLDLTRNFEPDIKHAALQRLLQYITSSDNFYGFLVCFLKVNLGTVLRSPSR